MKMEAREPKGLMVKYERLYNICFACGHLDHLLKECMDKLSDISEEDEESLPFGPLLKVTPRKSHVVLR